MSNRIEGRGTAVALADLAAATVLGDSLDLFRGRSVLLATREQLSTALALLELDGVARRLVLCTPDLSAEQIAAVAATARTELVVSDEGMKIAVAGVPAPTLVTLPPRPSPLVRGGAAKPGVEKTEWVLLTSGTTGTPKLVMHTLESLAGTLPRRAPGAEGAVWSTFYDIRRYGGLQIFLRAILGGSSLVLSSADEPVEEFLARVAAAGVTHISGTPSHWRRALMSGAAGSFHPAYVRLSGEVADQALLDALRAGFPAARIAHAFASTEAGVAFDVTDGLAGFPQSFIEQPVNDIELKIKEGTLHIRSRRRAERYLGHSPPTLAAADGFVDTGDMVELVGGRYLFRGRRGGVINVGGLKVYPEEVESVLNADPRVRMSLVRARRSPITGAIVVADVVLADAATPHADPANTDQLKNELLSNCRRVLPPHKVPAALRFVPALEMNAAGKVVRPGA
jgi:acyl-coenzyme A synthetase/AMP-(fatty) acid ligase